MRIVKHSREEDPKGSTIHLRIGDWAIGLMWPLRIMGHGVFSLDRYYFKRIYRSRLDGTCCFVRFLWFSIGFVDPSSPFNED